MKLSIGRYVLALLVDDMIERNTTTSRLCGKCYAVLRCMARLYGVHECIGEEIPSVQGQPLREKACRQSKMAPRVVVVRQRYFCSLLAQNNVHIITSKALPMISI